MIHCKGCTTLFEPQHAGHTFCTALCYGAYIRQHAVYRLPTNAQLRALMRPLALTILLLLPTLALAQPARPRPRAAPATYYVSPQGSPMHTCQQATSPSTPRQTVNQGLACLAGGDTLMLGDGVYHEQIADVAGDETPNTIRPPSGLSWSQPTTIKAANPRKAILDKPQAPHPYTYVVFLGRADTRYISIEGLVH